MISFFPNGCIQTKLNICSCPECLKGKFAKCSFKAGKAYFTECSDDEFSELNSDEEIENDDLCCENENVTEKNEVRADCVVDVVQPCSYVALYSPPESFELFYLCYVIESGIASESMCDMIIIMLLRKVQSILSVITLKRNQKRRVIFFTRC